MTSYVVLVLMLTGVEGLFGGYPHIQPEVYAVFDTFRDCKREQTAVRSGTLWAPDRLKPTGQLKVHDAVCVPMRGPRP